MYAVLRAFFSGDVEGVFRRIITRTLMTPKSGIASKRFCVIYESEVAIGETRTGIAGADAAVQGMSAKNPDGRYRRDEPTRYKRFFGDDLIEEGQFRT
jgi:hypothetical protein